MYLTFRLRSQRALFRAAAVLLGAADPSQSPQLLRRMRSEPEYSTQSPDPVGSLIAEVEPMGNVGRTIVVTSLALLLLLPALPTHALLDTSPFMLCFALFAACGQTQPPWVDEIEHALGTYFKQKYPASNFAPYLKALDRVRAAVDGGDHRTAKIEMGLFLTMLAITLKASTRRRRMSCPSSRSG